MSNQQPTSTFLGIAAAVMVASNVHAADIFVPSGEPTIQAGITAAINGDVVIVAQGEYFETINFNGKAITVRSTDPTDAGVVLNTIINGTGFFHVVLCVSGEGPGTVLSGFVITGGNANGPCCTNNSGGGMFINLFSSPTVTNCTFSGNAATSNGGGMFIGNGSNPTVTNCTFSGNSATGFGGGGGGMHNQESSPTVTNCTFSGNTGGRGGGGMFNADKSSPTVTNCSFIGNTATFGGGGMFNNLSSPTVTNTGFCDNTPDQIAGSPIADGGGNSLLYCPPPIPPPDPCPTDTNGDGVTNVLDLIDLLLAFGTVCP